MSQPSKQGRDSPSISWKVCSRTSYELYLSFHFTLAQIHQKPLRKKSYDSTKDGLPSESPTCRYSLCLRLLQFFLSLQPFLCGEPGAKRASFSLSAKVGITTLLQPHQMPLSSDCGLEQSAAFVLVLISQPWSWKPSWTGVFSKTLTWIQKD